MLAVAGVSVLMLSGPMLAACSSDADSNANSNANSNADATVAVTAIVSLTGTGEPYGLGQSRGMELAVEQLGADRVDLTVLDDASTTEGATAAMEQAIAAGVPLLFTPTLSPLAATTAPLAQQAGIPMLGATNATLDIAAVGDRMWRVSQSERAMVRASVTAAAETRGVRTAAMVWEPSDGYSVGSAQAFRDAAAANGIEIVAEVEYVSGTSSADVVIAQAVAGEPDALLMPLRSAVASAVIASAGSIAADQVRIGGNGFNAPEVIAAGGRFTDGLMVASSWNIASTLPMSTEFVSAYRAQFGVDPDSFAAQGYAAIQVLLAALDAADGTTAADLQQGLRTMGPVETVLGTFDFDADREPTYPPVVQVVENGSFTILTLSRL